MAEEQRPLNRVALVTGAAQGIGEAIALQLAQDGLDVAINDVPDKEAQLAKVAQAILSKGRRAVVVCGDVSSEPDVAAIVSRTVADLGGLDVVCKVTVPVPTPVVIPLIRATCRRWLRTLGSHISVRSRSTASKIGIASSP